MQIGENGKKYNLNQVSEYIEKDEIINDKNKELAPLFDYFDNYDGIGDGKISKSTLKSIFNALSKMDENKDDILSDEEIKKNTCKYLKDFLNKCKGVKISQFRNFLEKILKVNSTDRFRITLGSANNGAREIGRQNIGRGMLETNRVYGKTSALDGKIGSFRQGRRGDCYLLAAINSIKNTSNGQSILSKNITRYKDGSVTITLPGALQLKQDLEKNYPDKKDLIQVTGKYHITKAGLQEALGHAGNEYSVGDLDVIAYEVAFETYRTELVKTRKALNIKETRRDHTAAGSMQGHSNNDILSSGYSYDATFILTGKKSEIYTAGVEKYNAAKLYKSGEYGYITKAQMEEQSAWSTKRVSEISSYTNSEAALYKKLQKYKGKEKIYAITFNVRVAQNGPDGKTKAGGGHALTIVKITDDIVYIQNPWYEDNKIEPIPMKDFLKMATGLGVSAMAAN